MATGLKNGIFLVVAKEIKKFALLWHVLFRFFHLESPGFPRETEPAGVYLSSIWLVIAIDIDIEELPCVIVEADKSQDLQAGEPGELLVSSSLSPRAEDWCSSLKTIREWEFSLIHFVLFRPSMNWMRPTHFGVENLPYSVYLFK